MTAALLNLLIGLGLITTSTIRAIQLWPPHTRRRPPDEPDTVAPPTDPETSN